MKYFYVLFLIIILCSCAIESDKSYIELIFENTISSADSENNNQNATVDEAFSWLESYDGNWIINGIYTDFFPPDPDYTGPQIDINDDPFMNLELQIDTTSNKFIFNDDCTFKLVDASEVTSKELSWMLFAPAWGILAEEMSRQMCGGIYYEEEGFFGKYTEGNPVKRITFENSSENSRYITTISLIISANGDLLLNIGDAGGTYTLLRSN